MIDTKVPAHLQKQPPRDFLLEILQGRKGGTKEQPAVAANSMRWVELHPNAARIAVPPDLPQELTPPHFHIIAQVCTGAATIRLVLPPPPLAAGRPSHWTKGALAGSLQRAGFDIGAVFYEQYG
jgi:hypothetical protein